MVTYRFKITFEDYDDISREIDIKTTQTFEDLHHAIHRSTGYKTDRPSSFYVSTDNWLKGDEIAFMPSERKVERGVALMTNSKLKNFIEDPHQKFYYIYNFDRPYDFHVELIKINLDADESKEYPFLFKSVGDAPRIIDKNAIIEASAAGATAVAVSEFDFLNELNFVPEDTEELESMAGSGINEQEAESEEEEESEFGESEEDEFGADEFGSESSEDY